MSKVFQVTTLRTEDFPAEQRSWVPRLLTPLNLFITNVTQLLNGRVRFVDNIPAQDYTLDFVYNGQDQKFRWDNVLQPRILLIGAMVEGASAIPICSTWNYDASTASVTVQFLKIDGSSLTLGTRYRTFVRIIP